MKAKPGSDKTGQAVRGLAALGFGSVEIGSISALPTAGNPKPRLWRLPADRAIMVWYGIPNPGAARVADNLKWVDMPVPLGININSTNHGQCAPALGRDEILADYLRSAKMLAPFGDYMVLTLSRPNTSEPDLFAKTGNLSLSLRLIEESGVKLPIFIKPAPDGGVAAMEPMLMEVESSSLAAGFIYNLSPQKPDGLKTPPHIYKGLPGAISGAPVFAKNLELVSQLYRRIDKKRHLVISSGGIFSPGDAYAYIKQGASLVQLLTSLAFEGPGVVKRINKGLLKLLKQDGLKSIADAVGTGNP